MFRPRTKPLESAEYLPNVDTDGALVARAPPSPLALPRPPPSFLKKGLNRAVGAADLAFGIQFTFFLKQELSYHVTNPNKLSNPHASHRLAPTCLLPPARNKYFEPPCSDRVAPTHAPSPALTLTSADPTRHKMQAAASAGNRPFFPPPFAPGDVPSTPSCSNMPTEPHA